jgi:hypothetical protein
MKSFRELCFKHTVAAVAVSVLASCGDGDSPSSEGKSVGTVPEQTAASHNHSSPERPLPAMAPPAVIAADAHLKGMWSPVTNWPLIPIHAVLMPDGKVLTYGTNGVGQQTGNFIYDVWDPAGGLGGGHLTLPNGTNTDIFCSTQTLLPDGSGVFIGGGDNWTGTSTTNLGNTNTTFFNRSDNSLKRGNELNRPRWYATSITLLNGETYIQGGRGGLDLPEVRDTQGNLRLLSSANTANLEPLYPRNFIAPNGLVFGYDTTGKMYEVNPSNTGAITDLGQFDGVNGTGGGDSSAAMFAPGMILQLGGNSEAAVVIDVRGPKPAVMATQVMSSKRRFVNATLLPNGHVLATGGSEVNNELVGVNNSAEIWNPATGTWTVGSSGVQARLYHSNALLLPDATVLVGGGGAPGPQTNLNVELYYPPYLFAAGGKLAVRPLIDSAPTVLNIGQTFKLQTRSAQPVARVVMVRGGSTTHSFNMGQRFVELAFTAANRQVTVQAPTHGADAPPGFYMVFVLDAAGVPSEAKMLRVNTADNPNPAIQPVLTRPEDQTGRLWTPKTLQLKATDPNGDALEFTANGLPPGLSLNPQTGRISGAPSRSGVFNITITASDGLNMARSQFVWRIDRSPYRY